MGLLKAHNALRVGGGSCVGDPAYGLRDDKLPEAAPWEEVENHGYGLCFNKDVIAAARAVWRPYVAKHQITGVSVPIQVGDERQKRAAENRHREEARSTAVVETAEHPSDHD